jgi:hypothetical protein
MNRIVIPAKRQNESIKFPFDFTSQLQAGETITSIAGTLSVVYWGLDPSPNTVIGTTSIASPVINVMLQNGVLGTIYTITITAGTSLGEFLTLAGALAIIPDLQ